MAEHLRYKTKLVGHNGWVTAISTSIEKPDMIISASRDKSVIVWQLTREAPYGYPLKSLLGHNHFVQDVDLSSDGQFALSASWDGTLRLWDLAQGKTHRHFVGHSRDVLSVAFSADNRQIVSGSRDGSVKVWNTLAQCKFNIKDHTDWVSCVKFSPATPNSPIVISGGWDKVVRVWDLSGWKSVHTLVGHKGYINTVTVSPDGSLCASGGEDGVAMLWDLAEGKQLYSLEAGNVIHALVFSPNRYWLCAATQTTIKLWDLESKNPIAELKPEFPPMSRKAQVPHCISLAWSADGNTLFAGFTDNNIHVWSVAQ